MKTIINKVKETKLIDWRKLKWFQGELKELSKDNYEKLKKSLIEKNFISPFYCWGDYILDGHHRRKVMELLEEEGYEIPEKLPGIFLDLKNKKEAAEVLLAINSQFAKITDDGLYEFMNEHEIDIKNMEDFELASIDINKFEAEFFKDIEVEEQEFDENMDIENECPKCGYKW